MLKGYILALPLIIYVYINYKYDLKCPVFLKTNLRSLGKKRRGVTCVFYNIK